jgi:sugar O-acyltransferase (sialic acid O-acetyltransferase NeuD family)
VLCSGDNLIGFLDDDDDKQGSEIFKGYKVIGKTVDVGKYRDCYCIVAVGDNHVRIEIVKKLVGTKFYTAIHPSAVIADTVKIGEGTVIMAGVVINVDTEIGKHCIINTAVTIDHDNRIGDFVHISPGAHLAGGVSVGEHSWICTGAVIINNIHVGEDVVLGASARALKDIDVPGVYVGTPARRVK